MHAHITHEKSFCSPRPLYSLHHLRHQRLSEISGCALHKRGSGGSIVQVGEHRFEDWVEVCTHEDHLSSSMSNLVISRITHVKKGGKDHIAGNVKPLGPVVGRRGDGIVEFAPVGRADDPPMAEADVDTASRIELSISDRALERRTIYKRSGQAIR
jgi:hypothetical protein